MPPVDTWRKHNLLWPIRQGPAEIHDNLQHSCEWNRWREEFVLERPSNETQSTSVASETQSTSVASETQSTSVASETQSTSVAMERWSVDHRAFTVETYFLKNRFCRCDSADISLALQYSSEGLCS